MEIRRSPTVSSGPWPILSHRALVAGVHLEPVVAVQKTYVVPLDLMAVGELLQDRIQDGVAPLEGVEQALCHRLHLAERQKQVAAHDGGLGYAGNKAAGEGEEAPRVLLQGH